MNSQMKRVAVLISLGAIIALVSTDASALGRKRHGANRSYSQPSGSVSNGGGTVVNDVVSNPSNPGTEVPPIGGGDSNPVPEPASLVLLGSALAGLGGYRGLRKRMARKS